MVLTRCITRAMAKSLAESDDRTHQVAGAALKVRVESEDSRQCKSFVVSYGGCTLTDIGDRFNDCIERLKGEMFELARKLAHELNEPLVEGRFVILSPDTIVRLANKAGVPDDVMVYVAEPIPHRPVRFHLQNGEHESGPWRTVEERALVRAVSSSADFSPEDDVQGPGYDVR